VQSAGESGHPDIRGEAVPQCQPSVGCAPYAQFTAVNLSGDTPAASSSFNALVVRYNWRIGYSINLLTTYQWSKALDNPSEWQGQEVSDTLRNFRDQRIDRSISAHDLPQSS
jgi:hypothetical protein